MPKFDEHMALHRMDCLSSHGDLSLYEFVKEKMERTPTEEIRPAVLHQRARLDRRRLRAGATIQGDIVGGRRRTIGWTTEFTRTGYGVREETSFPCESNLYYCGK